MEEVALAVLHFHHVVDWRCFIHYLTRDGHANRRLVVEVDPLEELTHAEWAIHTVRGQARPQTDFVLNDLRHILDRAWLILGEPKELLCLLAWRHVIYST